MRAGVLHWARKRQKKNQNGRISGIKRKKGEAAEIRKSGRYLGREKRSSSQKVRREGGSKGGAAGVILPRGYSIEKA